MQNCKRAYGCVSAWIPCGVSRFNILIIANVSLAAIKIGGVMLGLQPWQSIVFATIATVIFTSLGGFRGVLFTDFLLFIVAMTGSFGAAYFALQQTGGMWSRQNLRSCITTFLTFLIFFWLLIFFFASC